MSKSIKVNKLFLDTKYKIMFGGKLNLLLKEHNLILHLVNRLHAKPINIRYLLWEGIFRKVVIKELSKLPFLIVNIL